MELTISSKLHSTQGRLLKSLLTVGEYLPWAQKGMIVDLIYVSSSIAKGTNKNLSPDSGGTLCCKSKVLISLVVMPRCALILKTINRDKISPWTQTSTPTSVCGLVGTSGPTCPPLPPLSLLTSVFLSTYLWPPWLDATLISTSCVLAQWSDLHEAT